MAAADNNEILSTSNGN